MNTAIEIIASDVNVERYAAETDCAFAFRTLYSASRFWAEALCINDGSDGTIGIAKQVFTRKFASWVSRIEAVASEASSWFMVNDGGIPRLYNRLIDIGDILEAGKGGELVARKPSVVDTQLGCALLIGTHDFTKKGDTYFDIAPENLITSGLSTIIGKNTPVKKKSDILPWLSETSRLTWECIEDYGDIEYVNAKSSKWNLYDSCTWTQKPTGFLDGLTLARKAPSASKSHQPFQFLLCKKASRSAKISKVSRIESYEAQELYFALRAKTGNPVTARYEKLDSKHIALAAPIGFLPGRFNRYVDAVSWPTENVSDNFNRVARVEVFDLINNALKASNVVLKERRR